MKLRELGIGIPFLFKDEAWDKFMEQVALSGLEIDLHDGNAEEVSE